MLLFTGNKIPEFGSFGLTFKGIRIHVDPAHTGYLVLHTEDK